MLKFLQENFVAIQQFVDMQKQGLPNAIPNNPVDPPRWECKEEDITRNTQRLSNQGPHLTRTVRRSRSRSVHHRLGLRSNVAHQEKTPELLSLMLDTDIMA
ncbi:hypothetical protein ACH5RR_033939 [Cinchona calisaya]|uniref:Uncharacterized protein n=1 Tax=Cinchona calisaya TaxID=153742 RepID=A0ABD2YAS4_9GENT